VGAVARSTVKSPLVSLVTLFRVPCFFGGVFLRGAAEVYVGGFNLFPDGKLNHLGTGLWGKTGSAWAMFRGEKMGESYRLWWGFFKPPRIELSHRFL